MKKLIVGLAVLVMVGMVGQVWGEDKITYRHYLLNENTYRYEYYIPKEDLAKIIEQYLRSKYVLPKGDTWITIYERCLGQDAHLYFFLDEPVEVIIKRKTKPPTE